MTMMNLPLNVVSFANNDAKILDVYRGMKDYYFHYMSKKENKDYGEFDSTLSLSEKEARMNKHIFAEIERLSGQPRAEGMDIMQWATSPMVKWAVDATRNMIIEAIIPDSIIKSIGLYTDIENVDYGQTAQFDIKPNSLMSTSTAGNAQRTAWVQKQFETSITLTPVNHNITVQASFYKVLAKKESLADFMRKAVLSTERDMTKDAYSALTGLVGTGTFPSQLKQTGYTQDGLLNLCNTISAYNQGNKAVIMGTNRALASVLPNGANGYRIVTPSDKMSIQLIDNFFGYDVLMLPQVAKGTSDFALTLNDKELYIISPSSDKIVKGCIEGTVISNSNDYYDNANLTSNYTMNKRWVFSAVTNSKMGLVTLG